MPWIKVDDHFDEHPKLAKVGPLGWALWLAGLAYCNRNLTDGFIPWAVARGLVSWEYLKVEVDGDNEREMIYTVDTGTGLHGEQVTCAFVIDMLVDVGLWDEVRAGYRIHDYGDYQPSKAEVLAEREKIKGRVDKFRRGRNATGNAVTNDNVTPLHRKSNGVGNGAPVSVSVSVSESLSLKENPAIVALLNRGWKRVTEKQKDLLWEIADRHDLRGHEGEWAAGIIQATAKDTDPLTAVKQADRAWVAQRQAEIDAEEKAWQATKDDEKRRLAN